MRPGGEVLVARETVVVIQSNSLGEEDWTEQAAPASSNRDTTAVDGNHGTVEVARAF
jgi:hypothetical protein